MLTARTRRDLLKISATAVLAPIAFAADHNTLGRKLGVVSASFGSHFSNKGGPMSLIDFPKFLRDELDLEVIDFNSMNFDSFAPDYLDKLRTAVADAGCIATNLKMNQKVDMNSPKAETRAEAMRVFKQSIDAARHLGLRWVRPLPLSERPDMDRHVAAYRELIDYASERGITVLIENFGWMMDDPDSVITLADRIGRDKVGIGIDTGNWSDNEVRYPALEKTLPLAVTCDFKAKAMTEDGEHPAYDLKRCFDIGWDAGFRGPWCFEHGGRDLKILKRNMGRLRDSLRGWMAERDA